MPEPEPGRVQKMTLRRQGHDLATTTTPIRVVADDGVTYRREVDADLVCATGVQVGAQQVDRIEPGQPDECCPGRLPFLHDRHATAIARVPGHRLVDDDL